MKKLLFATAIAASAAAFANPINAIDFESYGQGDAINPGSQEGEAVNGFFYFAGDSDSSVVSNDANAASSTQRTAYFAEENNAKFLALDTEGGTLWRSINQAWDAVGSSNYLGTAQAVASTGTYLDTLVQFTVTEDEAPEVGSGDKLAIWLQAGEGTTNLMVKAAVVDDQAGRTETTFTVTGTTVEPGTWYRLTVKAFADITDGELIPGFQIFLDGNLVTADKPTLTTEYLELLDTDSHYADINANKYFASLKTTTTLQGVGFQGTGAVDEIVWTEEDPFPAAVVEFTLTYSGDANVTALGAVTYTIGDDPTAQTPVEDKIPDGAEVTIAAPTFASGYQLAALTVDGTPVASPTFPYTFTMSANTTVAITSAQITYTLTIPAVANAIAVVTANGTPVSDITAIPAGTEVLVTWTAASGYEITAGATQNITMNSDVTATAPTVQEIVTEDWVDDVSTITAGTKASEQYPSLAGTTVANADAAQLTTWAKSVGNVSFADAGEDEINVEAFLLNIANDSTAEQIAAEKDAFVLNITIAADGTPVVTTPTGKTYNGTLQLKGSTNLSTWTNIAAPSKSYNFYKYELSLPAAE